MHWESSTGFWKVFQVSERAESAVADDDGQLLNTFQSSQMKALEVCALEQSEITRSLFHDVSASLSVWIYQSHIFLSLLKTFFPWVDERILWHWILPQIASASEEWHLSPEPFSTRINADGHLGSTEEPVTGFGTKAKLICALSSLCAVIIFCQINETKSNIRKPNIMIERLSSTSWTVSRTHFWK